MLTWTGTVLLVIGVLMVGPSLAPYVTSRVHSPPLRQTNAPLTSISPVADPSATAMVDRPLGRPLLPLFEHDEAEPTILTPIPHPSVPTPTPVGRPPTRIVIPSIGVDASVVPTGWQMVDIGGSLQPVWLVPEARFAGWQEGSAPLGVPGNTVINGHNWPENAVFRDLYQIEPGERIVLYSGSLPLVYEVAEVLLLREAGQPLEVRQANARYIQPTDDERVTLVTCHPYAQLTYRLIVIARPTEAIQPGAGEE